LGLLTAACFLTVLARRGRLSPVPARAGLLLLLMTDLWWVGHGHANVTFPVQHCGVGAETARFLKDQEGPFRVMTLFSQSLNDPLLDRLESVTGYDSFIWGRYDRCFQRFQGRARPEPAFSYETGTPSVLMPRELSGVLPGRPRVFRGSLYDVFHDPTALPRAWLVPAARVLPGPDAVLETMTAPGFDPRREVLLEEPPPANVHLRSAEDGEDPGSGRAQAASPASGLPAGTPARLGVAEEERRQATGDDGGERADGSVASGFPGGSCRYVPVHPGAVVVEADVATPAWLVVSDMAWPGWRARAATGPTGETAVVERRIFTANVLCRALWLEPGRHRLVFTYEPVSFRLGLLLTALTALAWLVALRHPRPPAIQR